MSCSSTKFSIREKTSVAFGYALAIVTIILLIVTDRKLESSDKKFYRVGLIIGYLICLTWESMMAFNIGWKVELKNCMGRDWFPKWAQILTQPINDQFILIYLMMLPAKKIFGQGKSLVQSFSKFSAPMLVWFMIVGILQEFLYVGYIDTFAYFPPKKGWNGLEIVNGTAMPLTWSILSPLYYFILHFYARSLEREDFKLSE